MNTKDLINAIASGDAQQIETTFESVMTEKISVALDAMRSSVAQNLFSEEVELDEEQLDELSKSTLGSYVKKAKSAIIGNAQVTGMSNVGDKTKAKAETTVSKRAKGINKAVDKLTEDEEVVEEVVEEGYDSRGAYEKHDPKHPDFVKNYTKFKSANPKGNIGDFVAHMKKQK